jgi:hypothetical protein
MHFKMTIPQGDRTLVWRTSAVNVEDGIEQFELAVLSGAIAKPEQLEANGYGEIEIGWAVDADDMAVWD